MSSLLARLEKSKTFPLASEQLPTLLGNSLWAHREKPTKIQKRLTEINQGSWCWPSFIRKCASLPYEEEGLVRESIPTTWDSSRLVLAWVIFSNATKWVKMGKGLEMSTRCQDTN